MMPDPKLSRGRSRGKPEADALTEEPRAAHAGGLPAWPWFFVIVASALIVRLVYLAQATAVPIFDHLMMDGAVYDAWAARIAGGDWLGEEVFYQAPLYPYFLAILKLFDDGQWPVRIVQAVLGSFSCGFLYLAGRIWFSRRVGVIAGIVLALYPPAIFFDGLVQKASIGGFFVTLLLWLLARATRVSTSGRWMSCGIVLGLLMLTREETLLLTPVILGFVLIHFRHQPWSTRGLFAAAYLTGITIAILPVALRNHHVGGEIVLTTSQAGSNFYIGNHAGAQGVYEPLRPGRSHTPLERVDARELAEIGAGRKLGPSEVSDYWFSRSFAWIRSHPLDWGLLLLRKLRLLMNAYEIPDYEDQGYYARFVPILAILSKVLHFGIVLPLAAAGICLTWGRRRELALPLILFATLGAGVVAFYVFARYRYPVVPLAILFAAAGIAGAWELFRARRMRRLVVPAIACVLVAIASNVPMMSPRAQLAMAHSNAGAVLADGGRDDEAMVEYRSALEIEPDDSDVLCNLAEALTRRQKLPEAVACFRRALAGRPEDPRVLKGLGVALFSSGDVRGAIAALRSSIDAWPRDPETWARLGMIHAQQGDWPNVLAVARRAASANPDDVTSALSLAWLLATVPDRAIRSPEEAVRIAEDLEQRTRGTDLRVQDVLAASYASAGRFDEAAAKARAAASAAEARGDLQFAAQLRERAEMYGLRRAVELPGR